uniref:Uncharacterized protein n=1 Tax=Cacopsylla melanoneura TaxID=428564 RepID=A0A8D8Q2J3_9HEMI
MEEFLKLHSFIRRGVLDRWFMQWQNCKIKAVRKMRAVYKRLDFLDPSVSPEHFSWVLMSLNYTGRTYKQVELGYGLIIVHQLQGSLAFHLSPNKVCYENQTCSSLSGTLFQGETLIFTNLLWNFEYIPWSVNTTSVTILTETFWN